MGSKGDWYKASRTKGKWIEASQSKARQNIEKAKQCEANANAGEKRLAENGT